MKHYFTAVFIFSVILFSCSNSYSQQGWFSISQASITSDLNEVNFINDMTGWASGELGTLIKTTNGGTTWSVINTGSTAYYSSV